jgi:peptidoglycan/LPS O-acetylase OafA/YrhL
MSEQRPAASDAGGYGLLDLLRWGSACLVAVGHVRNLLFLDYGDVPHANFLVKAFYALTGLGHEAVIAFFVISGYLVGGGLIARGATRESLHDYFIHRFSRIYIVLLPALAITAMLDLLGTLASASLYNEAGWASALDFSAAEHTSGFILVCNLANLQDAFCPSFGSNAPLWSLAYEWFYYLSFPFLIALAGDFQNRGLTARSVATGALAILVLAWLFPNFVSYYPIWLLGVGARVIVLRCPISIHWACAALVLLPITVGIARPHTYPAFITDSLIGMALALLLCSPRMLPGPRLLSAFGSIMAGFSYSLYVVHFPLLVFMVAVLTRSGVMLGRLAPGPQAFALLCASLLLLYGFAWAFSLATERQTQRLRRLLSEWPAVRELLDLGIRLAFRAPAPGHRPRLGQSERP